MLLPCSWRCCDRHSSGGQCRRAKACGIVAAPALAGGAAAADGPGAADCGRTASCSAAKTSVCVGTGSIVAAAASAGAGAAAVLARVQHPAEWVVVIVRCLWSQTAAQLKFEGGDLSFQHRPSAPGCTRSCQMPISLISGVVTDIAPTCAAGGSAAGACAARGSAAGAATGWKRRSSAACEPPKLWPAPAGALSSGGMAHAAARSSSSGCGALFPVAPPPPPPPEPQASRKAASGCMPAIAPGVDADAAPSSKPHTSMPTWKCQHRRVSSLMYVNTITDQQSAHDHHRGMHCQHTSTTARQIGIGSCDTTTKPTGELASSAAAKVGGGVLPRCTGLTG